MAKRCSHCGKPAVTTKLCKHGNQWCRACGKHVDHAYEKECGETKLE